MWEFIHNNKKNVWEIDLLYITKDNKAQEITRRSLSLATCIFIGSCRRALNQKSQVLRYNIR